MQYKVQFIKIPQFVGHKTRGENVRHLSPLVVDKHKIGLKCLLLSLQK